MLNTFYDLFKKRENLNKQLDLNRDEIVKNIVKISNEDMKNMSYEEMKNLYEKIYFFDVFNSIKSDYLRIMEEKKMVIYPAIKKAHRYPTLNSLDLPLDIIKALDDALGKTRVGNFIYPTSDVWHSLFQYVEYLIPLGIVERYVRIQADIDDEDELDDNYEVLKSLELDKHKRVWDLYARIRYLKENTDLSSSIKNEIEDLYKKIEELEVDGYGYLFIGDYVEINSLEEYEKISKNNTIMYKLLIAPDRTYDNL